jgi:small conductance mechanosensitive channel
VPFTIFLFRKGRIDLAAGVSYAEDLDKVEDVVLGIIKKLEGVIDKDQIGCDYSKFDSSSINFNIRFWVEYPGEPGYLKMKTKPSKRLRALLMNKVLLFLFHLEHWTLELKAGKNSHKWN